MLRQIREDIDCILERDPAARSRFEIITCYPGLHAIIIHRFAHRLWGMGWAWPARFISYVGRMITGIEIHPGARLGRRVFMDHGLGIVIGETADVGDDCTIYQGVTLGGTRLYKGEKRHPTLERGVVVGAGAKILGGFSVGENARVGSNAVVIKPVPAGATAVGNPARIVQKGDKDGVRPSMAESSPEPRRAPRSPIPTPCETDWDGKPLQELLRRGKTESGAEGDATGFAAYGVDQNLDDPLVVVLHELIDHAASQERRIAKLCQALEELGQRVDGESDRLDVERLNRMVD